MTTSLEPPKGGPKGPQLTTKSWKIALACVSSIFCHLADNFHPILYFSICRGSFCLLPGFYAFLYSFFVQISVSCFYNLVFAIYRAEAFQLEIPESCGTIIDSCLVSPRFTKTGETLEGLMFPITSLITDQSAPLKCALSGCLRWCTSHVYAH